MLWRRLQNCKLMDFGMQWSSFNTQRSLVAIWYIVRAQRGSRTTTLGPRYIQDVYIDPGDDSRYCLVSGIAYP